jgi:putative ABC transport system permease protein
MLRLTDITKDYKVADTKVRALKGLTLSFRENEFVSVLGPSGCGKTTLLNLVGGLDKYTAGDLYIDGRSTKEFGDKDWDVYRNRRIGFVFQSYNLIPHQTVLGNVELALTIAGLPKAEREAKAKLALDRVGLTEQLHKRPNQLSGGQCQRVAIARALVNDPDILLADEPTGALDTVTSEQIMDLIKQISGEKLVIMVTHNPDIAEKYSTRIIRLLDGELQSDTRPFSGDDEAKEVEARKARGGEYTAATAAADKANAAGITAVVTDTATAKGTTQPVTAAQTVSTAAATMAVAPPLSKRKKPKKEKAKMSFLTAFKLSLQNLFTKKTRTVLTAIAGSIGIIGVSLVLSISYGMQGYISDMQNDMLSGNPIEVTEQGIDFAGLMSQTGTSDRISAVKKEGFVNVNSLIDYLVKQMGVVNNAFFKNDITQEYIDYIKTLPPEQLAAMFLDYGVEIANNVYTDFTVSAGDAPERASLAHIRNIYTSVLKKTDFAEYATYISSFTDVCKQMPDSTDYLLEQYNIVSGDIA